MLFLKFLLLKPTYQSSTQARQIQRINSLRLLHLASSRLIFRALLIISITFERHSFTFIIAVLHLQYLSSKLIHIDFVYDKVLTKRQGINKDTHFIFEDIETGVLFNTYLGAAVTKALLTSAGLWMTQQVQSISTVYSYELLKA
jgi:hypothetical protein